MGAKGRVFIKKNCRNRQEQGRLPLFRDNFVTKKGLIYDLNRDSIDYWK